MTAKTKTVAMYEHAYQSNTCELILCSECAESASAVGPWVKNTPELVCQNHRDATASRTRYLCAARFSGGQEVLGLFSYPWEAEKAAMEWLEERSKVSGASAEIYMVEKAITPKDLGEGWDFKDGCYNEAELDVLREALSRFQKLAEAKMAEWFDKAPERSVKGLEGSKLVMQGSWPRIFKG